MSIAFDFEMVVGLLSCSEFVWEEVYEEVGNMLEKIGKIKIGRKSFRTLKNIDIKHACLNFITQI